MRLPYFLPILSALFPAFLTAQVFPLTVTVPGRSNPFLAGQPDGATAKSDSAPAQSPVLAASVAPGDVLTFAATGSVSYGGGLPTHPPDGGFLISTASALGIAGYPTTLLPVDALVGVFLGEEIPSDPAPDEISYPAGGLAYPLLAPLPRQIFYIGDGRTGNGTGEIQQIVVPAGATRLYLGTTDGFGWYNNSGEFEVTINRLNNNPNQPRVGPTTVRFDRPAYTADLDVPVAASILIDPVPLGGLYSQGMIITVRDREGSLAGFINPTPPATLNFDGPLLGAPGAVSAVGGSGGVKGSARFSTLRETLNQATLATLGISGLPPGLYDLAITPWNELGPTEDIFVTGLSETLDEYITFEPSTLEIIGFVLPEITVSGTIRLQAQTGLLEQRLTVTNNTGRAITAFRLFVTGLPADVVLWNAHGTIDGVPYIDVFADLAAGESMEVILEYRRPNRNPGFAPAFLVGAPVGPPPAAGGKAPLNLDLRVVRKDHAGLLVEFLSEKDKRYLFEYSDNMQDWHVSLPVVIGTGDRIQWLDGGPPRTRAIPTQARFYRVSED
jgi:hypothetical protein